MATFIITMTTLQYLQDLNAVFYSLFHPGIQDVFDWSETGTIIKGGEETHANAAGQGRRSGYPATSLIKGLHAGKKNRVRSCENGKLISKFPLNTLWEIKCNLKPSLQLLYYRGNRKKKGFWQPTICFQLFQMKDLTI